MASTTEPDFVALFIIVGLALIAAAIPLALRKVPANSTFGFRTPMTLANEDVWFAVNAKVGVDFCIVGLGLIALAVLAGLSMLDQTVFIMSSLIWLMFGSLASAIHGGIVATRVGADMKRSG